MSKNWSQTLAEHRITVEALAEAGPTLDAIVETVANCLFTGKRVFIFGNGGSAADAQHIAAELLGRFKSDRQALPAIALTTDSSTLTAIGNDLGYERVFSRQLEGLMQPGDVAWALSTSGNSPNIIAAAELVRARGGTLIGFTGETGGKLAPLCTLVFKAPHSSSDRIQECHLLAYHYICGEIETRAAARQARA